MGNTAVGFSVRIFHLFTDESIFTSILSYQVYSYTTC